MGKDLRLLAEQAWTCWNATTIASLLMTFSWRCWAPQLVCHTWSAKQRTEYPTQKTSEDLLPAGGLGRQWLFAADHLTAARGMSVRSSEPKVSWKEREVQGVPLKIGSPKTTWLMINWLIDQQWLILIHQFHQLIFPIKLNHFWPHFWTQQQSRWTHPCQPCSCSMAAAPGMCRGAVEGNILENHGENVGKRGKGWWES